MQVKCEYCGGFVEATADHCPNCGAVNTHMARAANGIPRTIEELQAFCAAHHVNLQKMHFHIGEDYKAPKAFGIFRDGSEFVVYKNKADGTRAVRYRGTDEAYAVNEIYQKLKAELQEVREHTAPAARQSAPQRAPSHGKLPPRSPQKPYNHTGTYKNAGSKSRLKLGCGAWVLIIFFGVPCALALISSLLQALGLYTPPPDNGYYSYGGQEYRYKDDTWYAYDDNFGWYYTDVDPYLADNYSDYWDSSSDPYGSTYGGDSSYSYSNDNNWDDDWDDDDWDWSWSYDDDDDWDWDWDSGSDWDYDWDYGSDWDSDW